ncbi:MAG: hypothetical protein ABR578_10050 [Chromatocurvus sp.]
MSSEPSIILTGDAPENEHHEVVSEFVLSAYGPRLSPVARASGVLGDDVNGATRNHYEARVLGVGYVELERLEEGVASAIDGFPGGGATNLALTEGDNVKLKLVTRNNGADVELEVWYNINDAGWTRIGGGAGVYTDVAPGATFTNPGLDGVRLQYGTASTDISVLDFYSNGLAAGADETAPVVTAFTINTPNVTDTTIIGISTFTATDAVGVSHYLITESATPPAAGAGGWVASAPTTYDLGSYRSATLYPWAKDAAGNVSAVYGTPVAVSAAAGDSTLPVGTGFGAVDASLIDDTVVVIDLLTATDDEGVTGYRITESGTKPGSTAGFTAVTPATSYSLAGTINYDLVTPRSTTLYAYFMDAAGNISDPIAGIPVQSVNSGGGSTVILSNSFNGGFNA